MLERDNIVSLYRIISLDISVTLKDFNNFSLGYLLLQHQGLARSNGKLFNLISYCLKLVKNQTVSLLS